MLFLGLAFPLNVAAWNNVGHRAIAELVWRKLPLAQRQSCSALLKQHPHYASLLLEGRPGAVSKEEWVFLRAAIWPDLIRKPRPGQPPKPQSVTKYDLYPHAIGFPIVWPENEANVSIEHFSVGHPNAEQVLSNCLATLQDPRESEPARAVALCWVLHLTGDLHQPLHAATIVTPQKPRGDSLGGDYFVIAPDGRKLHLHAFWDDLAGVNPSYESVCRVADEISADTSLSAVRLTEYREHCSIPSWVRESYEVARDFAYAREQVTYAHKDALDSGKLSDAQIPKLSRQYAGKARRIAFRRLALAALRLRDELNSSLSP